MTMQKMICSAITLDNLVLKQRADPSSIPNEEEMSAIEYYKMVTNAIYGALSFSFKLGTFFGNHLIELDITEEQLLERVTDIFQHTLSKMLGFELKKFVCISFNLELEEDSLTLVVRANTDEHVLEGSENNAQNFLRNAYNEAMMQHKQDMELSEIKDAMQGKLSSVVEVLGAISERADEIVEGDSDIQEEDEDRVRVVSIDLSNLPKRTVH